MKILFTLFSCVALISCSKSHDLIAPKTSPAIQYTLEFELAEEENSIYNIELSKDGSNFETIDTLHFNPAKNGKYTYDISLGRKQLVRVSSINTAGNKVYSTIVQAN
ncbi:MAG TPA: hypothetical protein VGO09_06035 [Flavisolibacter sp.]|nr:hypothetical protein [Flavisolibacter sp.]